MLIENGALFSKRSSGLSLRFELARHVFSLADGNETSLCYWLYLVNKTRNAANEVKTRIITFVPSSKNTKRYFLPSFVSVQMFLFASWHEQSSSARQITQNEKSKLGLQVFSNRKPQIFETSAKPLSLTSLKWCTLKSQCFLHSLGVLYCIVLYGYRKSYVTYDESRNTFRIICLSCDNISYKPCKLIDLPLYKIRQIW